MPLTEVSNFQTGDIILYHELGDNFFLNVFGRLVRLVTGGKYVHGALYIGNHEKFGPIIAEALASGFIMHIGADLSGDHYRYIDGLNSQQKNNIISGCLARSGYSYGYLDLFKVLIYKITGLRIFKESVRDLTCVEAITRIFQEDLSIALIDKPDLDLTYPDDIARSNKIIRVE